MLVFAACAALAAAESVPDAAAEKPFVYIGVLSGANAYKYALRRDNVRKHCWPEYSKHADVRYSFFVGEPDEHLPKIYPRQGELASPKEQAVAERIQSEATQFRDILVVPERDEYRDKTGKVMDLLRRGIDSGAKYIMKTDDDMCINLKWALPFLQNHTGKEELYMGRYLFKGTEYANMKGPHDSVARFMGGSSYMLSANLARYLVDPAYDEVHSALYETYGTSSEDANVGKWIAYAQKTHGVAVKYEANRHFAWPIDGVDDGSETFPNKKETPAMKMQVGVPEVGPSANQPHIKTKTTTILPPLERKAGLVQRSSAEKIHAHSHQLRNGAHAGAH